MHEGEVCKRWKSPSSKLAPEATQLVSLDKWFRFSAVCVRFLCVQGNRTAVKDYIIYFKTVKCRFFPPQHHNCNSSQQASWNQLPTDVCSWLCDLYIWRLHCEITLGQNLQKSVYALSAKALSLKAAFRNTFFWKTILTGCVLSSYTDYMEVHSPLD